MSVIIKVTLKSNNEPVLMIFFKFTCWVHMHVLWFLVFWWQCCVAFVFFFGFWPCTVGCRFCFLFLSLLTGSFWRAFNDLQFHHLAGHLKIQFESSFTTVPHCNLLQGRSCSLKTVVCFSYTRTFRTVVSGPPQLQFYHHRELHGGPWFYRTVVSILPVAWRLLQFHTIVFSEGWCWSSWRGRWIFVLFS